MKKSIALAFRRIADKLDPTGQRWGVTNITVNNCRATGDDTLRIMQAQQRQSEAYKNAAAAVRSVNEEFSRRVAKEPRRTIMDAVDGVAAAIEVLTNRLPDAQEDKSWATTFDKGLVRAGSNPTLPNAAAISDLFNISKVLAPKPRWWRRLLHRFGR
ncbi:hypothetical protein HBE99_04500 [Mycobacteroides chelonae]|uniref:hypothetical protein n=1 Tax=Mycobacteroides chelonae TaxID=1774 RepID=UPI00190FFCAF|nr:hypothetical protein [Mycobacteroides chelonae]QQG96206.1 hypothetical protein HBE99_04500 [Mycobacteroides chelonae]